MINPNEHAEPDHEDLEKGNAQSELMQQRMIEMIEQMKSQGKDRFETEYKH